MQPAKFSFEAVLQFLDYAGEKGLLNASTVKGYRTAMAKIQDEVTEQEAADVRQLDANDVFQRFVNRNRVELSPGSLSEYKRRVRTSIEEYLTWVADPTSYKPKGQGRTRDRKKSTEAQKASTTPPDERSTRKSDDQRERTSPVLTIPFPLRADFVASVQIPRDMKIGEAERLAAFVRTLAVDFEP